MREDRLWRHFLQPRSAVGLGMFRIVYSLTLLGEVAQLCSLRHLVFDEVPYQVASSFFTGPLFGLWMLSIICLMIGLFTRGAAVVNYLMTLLTFSTFHYWEYHVDYVYTGINCFLMVVPVGRALSVDAWLRRRRAIREGSPVPPETVPRIHYDALILVGIALVYFDSVFYKLSSPMWMSGLGLWRPASLPHNTHWNVGWLLDLKPLMLTLSHVTLVFECLFLPLMWFDRLRPWLFVLGVGLHLGIVVMFPIPWFGFTVFGLYLLLIPDAWWMALASWSRQLLGRPASITLPGDLPPAPPAPAAPLTPFDLLSVKLVLSLAVIVSMTQFLMTATADLSRDFTATVGGESIRKPFEQLAVQTHSLWRIPFGVTRHPVFMDFHFDGYESFYTLVAVDADGTQTWLPMAAPTGQGRLGWSGRLWVNWTWRVSNPHPDARMMRRGFERVTAWWLGRQGRKPDNAKFLVMRRHCDPCNGWNKGYYQRQLAHTWEPVGVAEWQNGTFALKLAADALEPSPSTAATTPVPDQPRRVAVGGD